MIQKLLEDYVDMFNQNFPTFTVADMEEEEIAKLIEQCLKDKKPYTAYDKDVVY